MLKRWSLFAAVAVMYLVSFAIVSAKAPSSPAAVQASRGSWTIPPNAADEQNPVAGDPQAIEAGKQLFGKNCKRCHGPLGKGDGEDADPDSQQDMDLTRADRVRQNPDGVVFYKLWNGRARPKMPAFKDEGLTKDQAWQIVAYVQTLRPKA